jgi:hypothetical protein
MRLEHIVAQTLGGFVAGVAGGIALDRRSYFDLDVLTLFEDTVGQTQSGSQSIDLDYLQYRRRNFDSYYSIAVGCASAVVASLINPNLDECIAGAVPAAIANYVGLKVGQAISRLFCEPPTREELDQLNGYLRELKTQIADTGTPDEFLSGKIGNHLTNVIDRTRNMRLAEIMYESFYTTVAQACLQNMIKKLLDSEDLGIVAIYNPKKPVLYSIAPNTHQVSVATFTTDNISYGILGTHHILEISGRPRTQETKPWDGTSGGLLTYALEYRHRGSVIITYQSKDPSPLRQHLFALSAYAQTVPREQIAFQE